MSEVFKVCGCGHPFTREEWNSLPLKFDYPSEDEDGTQYRSEFKDCRCGSTIGIEFKKTEDGEILSSI